MSTAKEEIETILSQCGVTEAERLQRARLFARSMLCELGEAVTEWEQVAKALEEMTADTAKCLRPVSH